MVYTDLFPAFPDDARCWIYVAERALTDAEQRRLLADLDAFFEAWTSHGRPVQGAATVHEDRFLVVAGHCPAGALSGCGIDASVHAVEAVAQQAGVRWLSPLLVYYRDAEGAVKSAPRAAFRKLVDLGAVTAETPVFDLSATTLGALRAGGLEKPAGRSWHARVFRMPSVTS